VDDLIQSTAWLESASGLHTPIHGTCFLGRSATSNIVLADDRISRRHAMVHAQGEDEYWLIDLGSSNGTYVNGRRISHPCRLADRDRIELGAQCFTFRHPKATPLTDAALTTTDKTVQDIKAVQCWLVVADIEASTRFIKSAAPEEGLRITGRWLSRCKQLIEERGGVINKFLGDGFLAYWPERGQAAGAVTQAARELKRIQQEAEPRFRVVVHVGKVFVGGGASLGEESLLGNEVNFVFRMEKLAGSLGVPCLLSEAASNQLQTLLPTEEAGRHALPGFDGQFKFFSF
jgi:adenylate cyclase